MTSGMPRACCYVISFRPSSRRRPCRMIKKSAAVLASLLLAGCGVGPDFQRAAAPTVGSYGSEPAVATGASGGVPGGAAQRFQRGGDIPAQWWQLFRSPALD